MSEAVSSIFSLFLIKLFLDKINKKIGIIKINQMYTKNFPQKLFVAGNSALLTVGLYSVVTTRFRTYLILYKKKNIKTRLIIINKKITQRKLFFNVIIY